MNCKKIIEKTAITWLDSKKASVSKEKYCTGCECNQVLGASEIMNFENTQEGREILKSDITEPFLTVILAVWSEAEEVPKTECEEIQESQESDNLEDIKIE